MSAIVSAAVDIPLSLSSEKNYIVEVVLPGGSTSANIEDGRITAEGASQALATVVYYDGLGRPEQTSRVGFTATGADLLSTVSYDEAGREYRQGLRFAQGEGRAEESRREEIAAAGFCY